MCGSITIGSTCASGDTSSSSSFQFCARRPSCTAVATEIAIKAAATNTRIVRCERSANGSSTPLQRAGGAGYFAGFVDTTSEHLAEALKMLLPAPSAQPTRCLADSSPCERAADAGEAARHRVGAEVLGLRGSGPAACRRRRVMVSSRSRSISWVMVKSVMARPFERSAWCSAGASARRRGTPRDRDAQVASRAVVYRLATASQSRLPRATWHDYQVSFSPDRYVAALRFAAAKHDGQRMAGSDLPYLVHVVSVAGEVIAASLDREPGLDAGPRGQLRAAPRHARGHRDHLRRAGRDVRRARSPMGCARCRSSTTRSRRPTGWPIRCAGSGCSRARSGS